MKTEEGVYNVKAWQDTYEEGTVWGVCGISRSLSAPLRRIN